MHRVHITKAETPLFLGEFRLFWGWNGRRTLLIVRSFAPDFLVPQFPQIEEHIFKTGAIRKLREATFAAFFEFLGNGFPFCELEFYPPVFINCGLLY